MDDFRPKLHQREFLLLRDLFIERAGLQFDQSFKSAFERRLGDRLAELGFQDFGSYYKHLRFSKDAEPEVAVALELLAPAETYFMRQEYQLESFRRECLPRLFETNAATLRLVVWSAGCSTGEEVYSLAILIKESGLFHGWNVRVVGSDLSRERVAAARRGIYREGAFRTTSQEIRERYFEPEAISSTTHHRSWRVNAELRQMCYFSQLNLLDARATASVGRVDAIFCRNVLIYFGSTARSTVIDNLYQRLVPGGYLFIGHSESLLNVSTAFELVHFDRDLVYRKPASSLRA